MVKKLPLDEESAKVTDSLYSILAINAPGRIYLLYCKLYIGADAVVTE